MKRIPHKAALPPPSNKPIIIEVDPESLNNELILPKISYQVHLQVNSEPVFNGMVLPFPKVLLFLLTQSELLIMAVLLEEMNNTGKCKLQLKELSARVDMTPVSVSKSLGDLRKLGLLLEARRGRRKNGRDRMINFKTIQYLNDLLEGEHIGIYRKIRKLTRVKNLENITKEDIKKLYNHVILEPDHDPAEEEEYD